MNCQNDECKRPFAADQIVFAVINDENVRVNCCSVACAKKIEAKLKQQEMFSRSEQMIYKVDQMSITNCRLLGIPITMTSEGGTKTNLIIDVPFGVSVDRVLDFDGGSFTLQIMQERLDEIKEDKKAKKGKAKNEKTAA